MRSSTLLTPILLLRLTACATEPPDAIEELGETEQSVLVNRFSILGVAGGCQYTSLSAAVAAAVPGQTILMAEGTTVVGLVGTINKNLTIRSGTTNCSAASAANAPKPQLDANHAGLLVTVTANVTFRQIQLTNGGAPLLPRGNMLISGGTTTLIDSIVSLGTSAQPPGDFNYYAGGIEVGSGATLNVQGTTLIIANRNSNWGAGGVIVQPGATAVFRGTSQVGSSLFLGNSAHQGAGGILAYGTVELREDARVAFNVADAGIGGGVHALEGGAVSLFDRVKVTNNLAVHGGGVGLSEGELHAVGTVEIAHNRASSSRGGGILVQGGLVDLDGTIVSDNEAVHCGGGIYIDEGFDDSDVTLTDVRIEDNDAGWCGGGVAIEAGTLLIDDGSIIARNDAGSDGGGLYQLGAATDVRLDDVTVDANTAAVRGGGIAAFGGSALTTIDVRVTGNVATGDGGGVNVTGPGASWTGALTSVLRNRGARGGGVFADGANVNLDETDIDDNTAVGEAGGVRVSTGTTFEMRFSTVSRNDAGTMGGGFAVPGGVLRLFDVDVSENTAATDGGGAVIANVGRLEASDVWWSSNVATGRGGALAVLAYAAGTNPQLILQGTRNQEGCVWRGLIGANQYCSEIRRNHANGGGGGIYLEDGTSSVTRTAVRQNTTTANATALWMRSVANGAPAVAVSNTLVVNNGAAGAVDSVHVAGGTFAGEAITSADNVGAPFRFAAGAGPALLQRSIVWDAANAVNASAAALGATCTMFRAVTGATVGANVVFGLDPVFVTTPRGNYRLGAASVNAIDKCTLGLAVDLDTDARPVNVLFDRGAFERQ